MKSKIGLLKKGLFKTDGVAFDCEGYINYSASIDSDDRRIALVNVCKTFEIAERIAGTQESIIYFAPKALSPNTYILECELDKKTQQNVFCPSYGLPIHSKGYSWDSPYVIRSDENEESFCTTAVISDSKSRIMGTFNFNVSLINDKEGYVFRLGLSLVYVRPQYRNSICGIDLSIAVARFSTELFKNTCLRYKGRKKIHVLIDADYTSRSGGRLGDLIADEFEIMFDTIRESWPLHRHKIGRFDLEMGF